MIFSFTIQAAHRLRPLSKLFISILFTAWLLTVGASNGLSGQNSDINRTHDGGGTWGSILELKVQVKGSLATFTVSKKKVFSTLKILFLFKPAVVKALLWSQEGFILATNQCLSV
ncbi:MAG: hypothetical protein D3923_17640 [Candidatus Electrothrix sp. AR3]|nr:hypothetical protein [Candidatus Electrothrix sp. AR3]